MKINFERLVSRNVGRFLSRELDLAGIKMDVARLLRYAIVGAITILIIVSFALFLLLKLNVFIAFFAGLAGAGLFVASIYLILEYLIDKRKTTMETMLPDFFQITSANLRSGIALDRAMLLGARPEFKFFSDDIKDMSRRIFGGETLDGALKGIGTRYRSYQLNHAIRMITESLRYGGAMADLLESISRDIRNQQILQKEVAGQLFMYSIFIAFAGLIAAPALYGLTGQMIAITDQVWNGILASNPHGLPSTGVSFLKPTPPQITPGTYTNFSIAAIVVITAFASLIMAAISTGSPVKGLKYLPLFVLGGIGIYFVVGKIVAGLFSGIGIG
jgi:archaeal flagellar protein FlaJ